MDLWIPGRNLSEVTSPSSVLNRAASQMPLIWRIDYLLMTIMISVLSFIGVVGNIPVLIVYFRRKDKKASNTFIKVLAFVDLLVCMFIMPYTIVYEFHLIESDVICRSFELTRHFVILASNATLVAIATERYIAVCQIGTKVSVSVINKGVMWIIVFSAIVAAPAAGTFAVVQAADLTDVECTFPHDVAPARFCHFTYSVMGHLLVTAYQGLLLVLFVAVLVVIIVLYTIVYVVLWNKTKIRRKMNRKRESMISDYEGLYSPRENAPPVVESIEEDEDDDEAMKEQCPETDACIPEDIDAKTPADTDASEQDSKNSPDQNGESVHIKSQMVISQLNEGIVAKLVAKRKKLNVSFGLAERKNKRRYYHRRTAKMLFLCTVIYFVTWVPFWLDIFGITNSKVIRYLFFIGHASNPIVYGIVNQQVRRSFKRLVYGCFKRWCNKGKLNTGREVSINSTSGTEIKVAAY